MSEHHTVTSNKYEQEVLFHINESHYWEEKAEESLKEYHFCMQQVQRHQMSLVKMEQPVCA